MKVGVIGVGAMGRNHARIYSELAELMSIADVDRKKGKEVANVLSVQWYEDYKDMLKSDVEAVSIATPTKTHYRIAKDAINAAKHVLVEKPICEKVSEACKLVEAAEKQGVVLAVGHVERYNPIVRYTKNCLESGRFGQLITISSRRVSSFPSRIKDVGAIFDLGIHEIDVMRYLIASKISTVDALGGTTSAATKFEDHAIILLEFENGVHGAIEVNWLTPTKVRKTTLTCTKGVAELDYINQLLTLSSSSILRYDVDNIFGTQIEYDTREFSVKKEEPLRNELKDFLGAVRKGRKPLVTGEDGVRAVQVAQAASKSYKVGRKLKVV